VVLIAILAALSSAITVIQGAWTAGSALVAPDQTAKGLVERALDIEASDPDGTGKTTFPRRWRRKAVPALADWLTAEATARLFLNCDDSGVSDELVSALGECLSAASAGLDANGVESLACSLLVVVLAQYAPQDVRTALERAKSASEGDQWRRFAASALETLEASADASRRVASLLSVPNGSYRRSIAQRLSFLVAEFVGREDTIEDLETIRPGEFVLLESDAGDGKSALAALLLLRFEERLWAPEADVLTFFRVSIDEGRRETASFLRALTQQLGRALPRDVPAGWSVEDMRDLAANMLAELVEQGRQPLLIVDGLDEQGSVVPTVTQVLSGLLSDDIACIATTRRNPDPTLRLAPDDPLRHARKLRLRPLNVAEVTEILTRRRLDGGLAAELCRVTRGNALYVRSVAVEMADRGENVLRDLSVDPPANVTVYFDSQFALLRDQVKADSRTWKSLVAVAAAAGPISRPDLGRFLRLTPAEVNDALQPAERYLLPDADLQYLHVELRRRVEREAGDLGPVRAQFLEWGDETLSSDGQLPDYVVRHHAAALAERGRDHDLVALISPRWMTARRAVDLTWRGLVQDVTLAMDALGQRNHAPNIDLLRLCYLRARLRSAAANLPESFFTALGASAQQERAEAIIDTIVDPVKVVGALIALSTTSEAEGADLFIRAEKVAGSITDPESRTRALAAIVQAMATRPELLGQAEELVGTITDPGLQAQALVAIVQAGGSQVLLARAEVVAASITYPGSQAEALAAIVRAGGPPELLARAEEIAATITESKSRLWGFLRAITSDRALTAIVQAMAARPELLARAEEIAATIINPRARAEALAAIVQAMAARPELLARAEEIAATIINPRARAEALAAIVQAMAARPELLARAEETAATIADPRARAEAFVEIVRAGGPPELLARAEETAATIADPRARAEAFVEIVRAGGPPELLARAEETAATITNSSFETEALVAIVRAGGPPELLARAEEIAATITDPGDHMRALGAVVQGMAARPELLARAEEIAATILDAGYQARALAAIVRAGGPPVLLARAEEMAATITNPGSRTWALAEIAEAMAARPELLARAEEIADAIPASEHRAEALAVITRAMAARPELLARAEEIADAITYTAYQARALAAIAQAGGSPELLARAEEIAATIPDPGAQAETLAAIVHAGGPPELLARAWDIAASIPDPRSQAQALAAIVKASGQPTVRETALTLALEPLFDAPDISSWFEWVPDAVSLLRGCDALDVISDVGNATIEIDRDFFGTPSVPLSRSSSTEPN